MCHPNHQAGDTLAFPIQASDADVSDVVTLGVIGLPARASFSIPAPSNPTAATFSWTPTVEQIGSQVVVFTAVDSAGLAERVLSQNGPAVPLLGR